MGKLEAAECYCNENGRVRGYGSTEMLTQIFNQNNFFSEFLCTGTDVWKFTVGIFLPMQHFCIWLIEVDSNESRTY